VYVTASAPVPAEFRLNDKTFSGDKSLFSRSTELSRFSRPKLE
jgi:hypothetical protein